MIQYNINLLHEYFAPKISEFTFAEIPILYDDFPQAFFWIKNHFLNQVFHRRYQLNYKDLVMQCIRKATSAFYFYHEAANLSRQYFLNYQPDNPNSKIYFRIMDNWESFFLSSQIFIDSLNKLNNKLSEPSVFAKGDNTIEERVYTISNHIKHFKTELNQESDYWLPFWLTNSGLESNRGIITYIECSLVLRDISAVAEHLSSK